MKSVHFSLNVRNVSVLNLVEASLVHISFAEYFDEVKEWSISSEGIELFTQASSPRV